jgi:hypothetical protein
MEKKMKKIKKEEINFNLKNFLKKIIFLQLLGISKEGNMKS